MGWIAPISLKAIWLLLIWGPKGCGGSRAQKERLNPLTRIGDVLPHDRVGGGSAVLAPDVLSSAAFGHDI